MDVEFEPRTTIKAPAIAEFIQETVWVLPNDGDLWKAYMDGFVTKDGSRAGIYIQKPRRHELHFTIEFNFHASNNDEEYEALVRTMRILLELEDTNVIIFCDSQLVTQQVLGTYEKKEERMITYATQVECLKKKFLNFEIVQIPREGNFEADKLARMAGSIEGA